MSADIVSWHPLLTDHQAYTLEALGEAANVQVTVNVTKNQDAVRMAQGWTEASVRTLTVRLIPRVNWLSFIIQQLRKRRNSVHLFGSPFEQPKLMLALFLAIRMGLRVYIISEPYSPIAVGYLEDGKKFSNKLKSWLRPLIYRIYGLVLIKHIEGIFAISPLAITQYNSMGIKADRIFPFGYFVPSTVTPPAKNWLPFTHSSSCKIVFVGNLITRKGLDLLIDAAKKLYASGGSFHIDVYGHGDPDAFAFDNAYIKYVGKIPFGQAQSIIVKYDLLVLPSRYDGWGVVVNEALLAGVPVVCSDVEVSIGMMFQMHCSTRFFPL
jgi:glycosyltransferase involved in cell wall biosynthesis